jgi:hypothetical protein
MYSSGYTFSLFVLHYREYLSTRRAPLDAPSPPRVSLLRLFFLETDSLLPRYRSFWPIIRLKTVQPGEEVTPLFQSGEYSSKVLTENRAELYRWGGWLGLAWLGLLRTSFLPKNRRTQPYPCNRNISPSSEKLFVVRISLLLLIESLVGLRSLLLARGTT